MKVHHVALRVADLARAESFYAGTLGLPLLRRLNDEQGQPRAVWVQADGVVLMLELALRGEGDTSGSGHVLAFAVDDLGPWEKRLEDAGHAVVDRTSFTIFVRDPDGHRVGLSVHRFGEAV